jgi:hypothetical protein
MAIPVFHSRLARGAWWLFFASALARAAGPVYDSPKGGFVFSAPDGWEIREEADAAFPSLFGPKDDPLAPYVVVSEAPGAQDLYSIGSATERQATKDPRYLLFGHDGFFTADKRFGLKYVYTINAPQSYRQVFYFVEGAPGHIYLILATVAEAGWKKYEPQLDQMVETYHLRPVVAPAASATPSEGAGAPAAPPLTTATPRRIGGH